MANQTRVVRAGSAAALPPDTLTAPTPGVAAAIFFAISLLYFLPAFLPTEHIFGTDYQAGGYFFYDFISQRFADGALPKWVPYIFGGMPLAANPGSTYYPFHVLGDLLLPTWKVLPFVFWMQFGIAGFGMYLLARELGCRNWIAFVAGVAFQFTGITMSWVYAGHDGRIIVATLAPLLFYFLHAGVRTARLAPFAGAAAAVGFALLSFQIQTAYYLLLAGAAWAVFSIVTLGIATRRTLLLKTLALGLGAVAFGFLMASVNFIPFLNYAPESTRGAGEEGRGYEYSTSYSMPEGEVLSMAVPEQAGVSVQDPNTGEPLFPEYRGENGFKLHTEYVGAFVLVLLALGGYYSRRNRYWWFLVGLSVFFMTVALGGNTPLYRLYYEILPGTKRFRAPSLSYFVVAMSLVAMAALTLERLAALRGSATKEAEGDRLDMVPWIVGGVLALAIVGAASAGGDPAAPGAPTAAQGWARFILFVCAVGGGLWMWVRGTLGPGGALLLLSLVTAADLWTIDRRFFHTVAPPDQAFAPDDVASFLQSQPGPFRVWSLPLPGIGTWGGGGSYGGDQPMYYGIEQVGGEHPNPLQRWNELVGAGTTTYIDWHNLLQNPRVIGDTISGQAVAFESEQGILDAANVRYVVSVAPLAHPALREVHRGSALVYENATALPRAYLVPSVRQTAVGGAEAAMGEPAWNPRQVAFVEGSPRVELPATPLTGSAQVTEYEPDRVVVRSRANRPALLVLADNMYEGWKATLDGTPADIHLVNHTFRGVVVPAGDHTVEFNFEPGDLRLGLYIYIATLAALAGYTVFLLLRSRRSATAEAVP
ncbi:MAG: hypothetical protein KY464_06620 [Gemmatimonadetes bacterium]|nr:hypothetical protein [Gemmatimonadota bacterium]